METISTNKNKIINKGVIRIMALIMTLFSKYRVPAAGKSPAKFWFNSISWCNHAIDIYSLAGEKNKKEKENDISCKHHRRAYLEAQFLEKRI